MERYALKNGPSGEFVIFADLLTGNFIIITILLSSYPSNIS